VLTQSGVGAPPELNFQAMVIVKPTTKPTTNESRKLTSVNLQNTDQMRPVTGR
jgi:hypothetical protein